MNDKLNQTMYSSYYIWIKESKDILKHKEHY